MFCEGSRLQSGGLTLLLISLPADSTTRSHDNKDKNLGRLEQGVGLEQSNNDGGLFVFWGEYSIFVCLVLHPRSNGTVNC